MTTPYEKEPADFEGAAPINFLAQDSDSYEGAYKRRLYTFAAVVIFGLLCVGYLVRALLPAVVPENPLAYDPVTLEPKSPEGFFRRLGHFVFSKDITLEGERNDRVNILLLGIGGPGHDGPYLSDTMILVSMKPSTKQVAMISLPRDLLVDIPGHGKYKLNHANAFGEAKRYGWGGAFATEVAAEAFDIDIPYYARIDFQAFEDIIDTIGGISINVDRSFTDPLYPAANFGYQTVSFARGAQTMDGRQALQYARSRHGSNGEGSDFARSKRQQKMLLALKEKILSAGTVTNPIRIKSIMDTVDEHMTTNMEFGEILSLVRMGREMNTAEIIQLPLDTSEDGRLISGTAPNGAFVLLPKSGDFDEINRAIAGIFEETAAIVVNDTPKQPAAPSARTAQTPTIEVQNGTWHAGLAARVKKRLTDESYTVGSIGNTTVRPITASAVYSVTGAADRSLLGTLTETLRIPAGTAVPAGVATASTTDILIILGEDFEE